VVAVTEVQGMEADVVVLQDLYRRSKPAEPGKPAPLEPTGLRPKLAELLAERGAPVDSANFRPDDVDLDRAERLRPRPTRFRADSVSYAPRGR
jgi:pilus assembly protein CpaF